MDIAVFGPEHTQAIQAGLTELGHTVTVYESPDAIPPNTAVVLGGVVSSDPPQPIDPLKQSVLFVDDASIEHVPTCYAFSSKWQKELLPIACFLFEKDQHPESDTEMETLFREYRRTLFVKLQFIVDLFEKAVTTPQQEELELLKHHVHKTAGSAGTYGFADVSVVCKELENELTTYLEEWGQGKTEPYPEGKKETYLTRIFEACIAQPEIPDTPQQPEISGEALQKATPTPDATVDFYYVDDDESLVKMIAAEAEKRGIRFKGETRFEAAQETIRDTSFRPRVALFDIFSEHEQITGYDLVQSFREVRQESLTTLIGIMSAKSELPDRVKATNLGIDVFFEKPVNTDFLLGQIEKVAQQTAKERTSIFLLDDDEEFCKAVQHALGSTGFVIEFATSTENLFQKIEAVKPDIMLLDIHIGEEDGIQILNTIRTDYRFRNITVIIVTASTEMDDVKKAYAAGARDFLSKPLDFNTLSSHLNSFLRKKEYMGLVYEKDPDLGLYTPRSMLDFFTTFSIRRSSFCVLCLAVLTENGDPITAPKQLRRAIGEKLLHFFSEQDVIGETDHFFVIEIVDYTLDQLRVLAETLHATLQESLKEVLESNSLCSVLMNYPNDGTTYEELMHKAAEELRKKETQKSWAIFTTEQSSRHSRTLTDASVILISSDPQLHAILKNALQLRDHPVIPFTSGHEAYEYILTHFFHERNSAVLLDGDLKDENGNTLLHKIKTIVGQRTPLYLFTSLAKEEDLSEAFNLGATRIFSKPLPLHVILDTLERDVTT